MRLEQILGYGYGASSMGVIGFLCFGVRVRVRSRRQRAAVFLW